VRQLAPSVQEPWIGNAGPLENHGFPLPFAPSWSLG